jgi:hypothetical protein
VNDEQYERLAGWVTARALHPNMPAPPTLSADQWTEIGRLADIENALFDDAHGAPALHEDPVAAFLGLVPDPHLSLEQSAFTRARKRAGVTASALAQALQGRGWDVTTGDVVRWQTKTNDDVSPALIKAIAAELRTTIDTLTTDRSTSTSTGALEQVTRTPAFAALVTRFAAARQIPAALAASTLRARALATVHRGEVPAAEQWLASLEAFVSALEDRNEP